MNIAHETILEVDFNALSDNLTYLKSKLKTNTKVIAVIKAYAYGHGDVRLAKKLESLGVYAFWVADFEEGTRLREAGITVPIIIANPGLKSVDKIIKHQLDVVIYNTDLLHLFGALNTNINIHIKFNTGMNRYGFENHEIAYIANALKKYPKLNVQSICSHLAASDTPSKDEFTLKQIEQFDLIHKQFSEATQLKVGRHILNTNGVLRFSKKQYEMVRLGIGLYGGAHDNNLKQISTLKSVISQLRTVPKGMSIGYNASYIAKKEMAIAVVPFGYADGLNRRLSENNGHVRLRNQTCPIIGKISMDSCIIDVSNCNCKLGDEVIIFGTSNTILSIAEKIKTIPYEIYATLNRRIKRIYVD